MLSNPPVVSFLKDIIDRFTSSSVGIICSTSIKESGKYDGTGCCGCFCIRAFNAISLFGDRGFIYLDYST